MVERFPNFVVKDDVKDDIMKKLGAICLAIILIVSLEGFSQDGKLTLHGRVENERNTISYVDIEIYRDNELYFSGQTQRNGSFKIDLDLGHIYNVNFNKEGFIDKSIGVISKLDSTISGRYFFQLDIQLFRVDQNVVDETMLPPVAKLYIRDESEGFRYDKKYVKWISDHYEDLE